MIRGQDYSKGWVDPSDLFKVGSVVEERYRNARVKAKDLIITIVGAGTGYVESVPEWLDGANLTQTTARIAVDPAKADSSFCKFILQSSFGKNQVSAYVKGAAQPGLNCGDVEKFLLPLPPSLSEQRAIAGTLSDVDALIGALDQHIAKKRDLKQAAMQQLFTGQTRLPGFHGEWEVKQLGAVFSISAGKSKSAYVASGGRYWVVDMGSVSRDGRLIVSKRTNYQGDFLKVGDLVMPKDDIGGGNIIGKVGLIDADDTYVLGDHVYCMRANVGDPLFLSYVINGYQTNNALRKKVIGSAQLGLGRKSAEEQEIPFPLLCEQTAIAEVLSDMDAELAALEQRRDKTRALKQGMMQELLTGRTRLV